MGYQIDYTQPPAPEAAKRSRRFFRKILLFSIAAIILCYSLTNPQPLVQPVKDLLPRELIAAFSALENLSHQLESGLPISAALEVFCDSVLPYDDPH